MMKNIFVLVFVVSSAFSVCAQGAGSNIPIKESEVKIKITVGGKEFTAITYDNGTAKAFISRLPITVNMNELNGNEKYYNFPQNLSVNSAQCPGTINTGDIMLWSSNCLVLFYKTFSTSYSYVKIGRIENVSGLETVLGSGNVEVTFIIDKQK
jgi:hypothetical protein